ncbi:unnamed protein product [Prorocentrum cordatum]|uniref:Uncharacterized protein n=1 Tax=Prorocentrum cordatum TaxID=2364126 RepID=A0ABN9S8N6_9DINO|nr:unnamed protein product [Polarella glacialis]
MKRTASDAGLEGRADEAFAWEDADPLYALFGDVGTEKVFGPAGELREELLEKYLEKAVVQGVVKKPKDWIELWARMDIPPDRQSEVLAPLMAFILRVRPKGLGRGRRILAELVMGHRTKTKAVQESAQQAYKGQRDESGSLREMMFLLFPKSPCFPNGWKRTGWDWKQWWQMTEKTLGHLDPIVR